MRIADNSRAALPLGAIIIALTTRSAHGETNEFIGPPGGSWFIPAHWSAGSLPAGQQIATSGVTFEIDDGGAEALALQCAADGSGFVILAGVGASLTTSGQWISAETGTATVTQFGGQNSPGNLQIGMGGTGRYTQYGGSITGAQFLVGTGSSGWSLPNSDGVYERFGGSASGTSLTMGKYGHHLGIFRQYAGSTTLTGSVSIGKQNSQPSRLEILGGSFSCAGALIGEGQQVGKGIVVVETASWSVTGDITFGEELSNGQLLVSDGGTVSAGSAHLAEGTGGSAGVYLTDPGSTVTINEEMVGSERGTKTVIEITNGASLATGEAYIGGLEHQYFGGPRILIDGEGSQWVDSGAVFNLRSWNGLYDNARIGLFNGGRLEVTKFKSTHACLYGDGGTIDGKVINLGTINPGLTPLQHPQLYQPTLGQLNVTGTCRQFGSYIDNNGQTVQATGATRIEIAGETPGSQHDMVTIGGAFEGGGALDLVFVSEYSPLLETTFDIISCASITGAFDVINVHGLNDNRSAIVEEFIIAGGPDVLRARVIQGPCPADLNGSDHVDVDDLLILINAWGICPSKQYCAPDVTVDGTVDTTDLVALINAWGTCAGP